jgi:hypothetical protein
MTKLKYSHVHGPVRIPGIEEPVNGLTVAYTTHTNEKGTTVRAGLSFCSSKDAFLKWKGRLISSGRYELAWGGRVHELSKARREKLENHTFYGDLNKEESIQDFLARFYKGV